MLKSVSLKKIASPTFTGTVDNQGGQIKFPATQSASADANTLDDYEEGTWTPVFRFGGAAVGMTFSAQTGLYTKIGNVVHLAGRVALSAKGTSTGSATIGGLPFTIQNSLAQPSVCVRWNLLAYTGAPQAYGSGNSTSINIEQIVEAGTVTLLTDTAFSATTSAIFSMTYFV